MIRNPYKTVQKLICNRSSSFNNKSIFKCKKNHQYKRLCLFNSQFVRYKVESLEPEPNYYELLEIDPDADIFDISKAFYEKKVSHSMVKISNFDDIKRAYLTLSNNNLRKQYDDSGYTYKPDIDIDDSKIDYSTIDDLFKDEVISSKSKPTANLNRGANIDINVSLTIEEGLQGCKKEVTYQAQRRCKSCNGTGSKLKMQLKKCKYCGGTGVNLLTIAKMSSDRIFCPECNGTGSEIPYPCTSCNATGLKKENYTTEINLPPGINDGDIVKVPEEGDHGKRLGTPGDLYVKININKVEDIVFDEKTNILHVPFPINTTTAVLGGEIDFQTLDGVRKVKIKPGTQHGHIILLSNCGVKIKDVNLRGDIALEVKVVIPKKLTDEQLNLIKDFASRDKELISGLDFDE